VDLKLGCRHDTNNHGYTKHRSVDEEREDERSGAHEASSDAPIAGGRQLLTFDTSMPFGSSGRLLLLVFHSLHGPMPMICTITSSSFAPS
jgi:hypothetical protein